MDNWANRRKGRCCKKCIHFAEKPAPEDERTHAIVGRCRRRAPVTEIGWPVVYADDWCGEFKLNEEKV